MKLNLRLSSSQSYLILLQQIMSANIHTHRYAKLRVAHAPVMPGTFSLRTRVSDPEMHHGTCGTHVLWCMSRSLTSGFLWSRRWGKRFRRFRGMRNAWFCSYGRRPIVILNITWPLLATFASWLSEQNDGYNMNNEIIYVCSCPSNQCQHG